MIENCAIACEDLLQRAKAAVLAIDPSAEVILYGSRARGDAEPDSDWDLLILMDGPADEQHRRMIRRSLYEIEWETGEVLTAIVHTRAEWDGPLCRITPFNRNVRQDGIPV